MVEESVSSILSMRSNVVGRRGRVSQEDNVWEGDSEERIDVSDEIEKEPRGEVGLCDSTDSCVKLIVLMNGGEETQEHV